MFRRTGAALVSILVLFSASALAAPVDPPTVSANLDPGASLTVAKTVHTPAIPPRPDIMFLADTTGSMGTALANVKANATSIMNTVRAAQADSQFGAANYQDFNCDPAPFTLDQAMTATIATAQAGINAWSLGDGCDAPEAQINALFQLANPATSGWRVGSTRIIAWFGDANGHDPSNGHTLLQAIAALQAEHVRVIAVPVVTPLPFGNGLDNGGQATQVTSATGGVLLPSASPSQVASAILTGLSNLPVAVSWTATCDAGLSVTLSPASVTVTSGTNATFTETITVAASATQGATLHCTVQILLNGQPATGFTESITIGVNDVTRPRAACEETTNPSGKNVPTAGANPKSGQNPDGFYVLSASDNVTGSPMIFVSDSASTFVAGPYASGTTIKLVQAPGATPNVKPGAGDIDWKITLNGDAIVSAVDGSGNISAAASCKVPPPPK
jgi:hypothetical protein